jgi:hypothetical protein
MEKKSKIRRTKYKCVTETKIARKAKSLLNATQIKKSKTIRNRKQKQDNRIIKQKSVCVNINVIVANKNNDSCCPPKRKKDTVKRK